MGERKVSTPPSADNDYLGLRLQNFIKEISEMPLSPERVNEIGELAKGLSDNELVGKEPVEVAKRNRLTGQEKMVFSCLIQIRRELDQAVEEGELSPDEAENWRELFGLNEGGKILMTIEELEEEYLEKLAAANEEERPELQKQMEGVIGGLRDFRSKPTVPGEGVIGEATKRMAKGKLPE